MATIILTAVGTAMGGPIGGTVGASVGGTIGALAGQAVDSLIFRPGPRSGPRLSDLQVQTSRYGAQIPKLFGTIRVAGMVIWSTDLIEHSATGGGGKGQPSVTSYSYSASFAVALSARRIVEVRRIWADGNLLRGAGGDFKSPLAALRIHPGDGDQPLDPLLAAATGATLTPASRGCAYAVFEGLELADFGNRIPSLTFEVVADEDAVGIDAILSDLAGREIGFDGEAPQLPGFAGEGGSLREVAAALIEVHGLQWREAGGELMLSAGSANGRLLDPGGEIRGIDGEAQAAGSIRRQPIETVPVRLAIHHHDPARDYQIGVQAAERPGPGQAVTDLDLPAVLAADAARGLAEAALRRALRRRTVQRLALGWAALDIAVGEVVQLAGQPGLWLVEARDWEDMAVRLTLRAFAAGPAPEVAGDSGAAVLQPDLVEGATSLALVEMPPDGMVLADVPMLLAGATGADAGWRRAALLRVRTDIEATEAIGRTAPRAVLGTTLTALGDGVAWRIDRGSSVEVMLDNGADALVTIDDGLLLQGANLCQIGEEWLQFGQAEEIAPGHYRLSRLLRGWHGTEWAMSGHEAGERLVLIDRARLAPVAMAAGDVGKLLEVQAIGSGDAVPAEALRMVDGRAMLPPTPVLGRTTLLPGGDRQIGWTRRSRLGWGWNDLGDVPLGEESERYRLSIMAAGGLIRERLLTEADWLYLAADQASDAALAGGPTWAEVRQRGTWGESRALIIALD